MTDTPHLPAEPPPSANHPADRPLVTFALFAFNQEAYIREAVEGAFAQTYQPLEIILSDDRSSDRTFQIMQEMAEAYRGPHKVVARRNQVNVGTASHVQNVAFAMGGELMVVAAGDDVSLPERVEKLVSMWLSQNPRPVVLHSQALALNDGDREPSRVAGLRFKDVDSVDVKWFSRTRRSPILAPTAAYAKCLFSEFPPLISGSLIEDGPMIFRGILSGRFKAILEPLVVHRVMRESAGRGYDVKGVARWNRFVRSKIISQMTKLQDLSAVSYEVPEAAKLQRRFCSDIRRLTRCFITEDTGKYWPNRLGFFFILLLVYPSDYSIKARLGFALKFCGFWRR